MSWLGSYLKEEKEKFNNIPGVAKKLQYIWQYYYLWIIGIIALIGFSTFAYVRYTTTIKEHWFYITFANTYADVGDHSELWDGFVERQGYDLKEKDVIFNNQSYFDYTKHVTGNSYFEQFVAYVDSGTLDALTMEEESLKATGSSGALMDLDDPRCASIKEKYGDRFVYCEPFDKDYGKDQVAVGIDVSDSVLMTKYNIYANNCVLGIGAKSGNIEAVEAFLDYIYE